jgi:hypothetical protein
MLVLESPPAKYIALTMAEYFDVKLFASEIVLTKKLRAD